MLITVLNIAGVVLIILALCVFLGAIAIANASGVGLLIAGIICLVVAYILTHRGRVV